MNYKKIIRNYITIAIGLFTLSSCQKVIDINLNSAASAIVIEANVSNQPGPYTVQLSKTVNFSDANTFPQVTGASVTITDNVGNSDILTETSPGKYITNTLQGIVGRTYSITVTAEGKSYQASVNMPAPVIIDTLIEHISNGFGGGPGSGEINRSVIAVYNDPAGIENYYRFIETINGVPVNTFTISSDKLRDGEMMSQRMRGSRDIKLEIGDSVNIQMQSIDKGVYDYFRTFNQSSGGGMNSSSPANPTSNISNGALGYFSAYSVTSKTIVIQ